MPRPLPRSPPTEEQLFNSRDLDAALKKAAESDPLAAYPALDKFISGQCHCMLHQLIGAGMPAVLAQELFGRMRAMGHVSALAMHGAIWREFLPVVSGPPSDPS